MKVGERVGQIIKIWNENGNITTDLTEIKRNIKEYYELLKIQLYRDDSYTIMISPLKVQFSEFYCIPRYIHLSS